MSYPKRLIVFLVASLAIAGLAVVLSEKREDDECHIAAKCEELTRFGGDEGLRDYGSFVVESCKYDELNGRWEVYLAPTEKTTEDAAKEWCRSYLDRHNAMGVVCEMIYPHEPMIDGRRAFRVHISKKGR